MCLVARMGYFLLVLAGFLGCRGSSESAHEALAISESGGGADSARLMPTPTTVRETSERPAVAPGSVARWQIGSVELMDLRRRMRHCLDMIPGRRCFGARLRIDVGDGGAAAGELVRQPGVDAVQDSGVESCVREELRLTHFHEQAAGSSFYLWLECRSDDP